MEDVNVLFVCTNNRMRSPTAEEIWSDADGYQTRSRGTAPTAERQVTRADVEWADVVIAMEDAHAEILRDAFPDATAQSDLHVLHIPDRYPRMDPKLIELLKERGGEVL